MKKLFFGLMLSTASCLQSFAEDAPLPAPAVSAPPPIMNHATSVDVRRNLLRAAEDRRAQEDLAKANAARINELKIKPDAQ